MEYINYSFRMASFLVIFLSTAFLISCDNQNHNEGHMEENDMHEDGHEEHDDHENEGKTVTLNTAQFLNTSIDTGRFSFKNLSEVVHANGYTKLDPDDEADVSMPISGTISNVKVIEGTYVKKGQLLAAMKSLEFNKILLQKSELEEELHTLEANTLFTKQEFDRQTVLAKDKINADKILQKVSAQLKSEEAKIKGLKNQINIVDQSISSIGSNNSSFIRIQAPISGYITDVNIKIGTLVKPGMVMFSLVDNREMHVDLLVYEKDLQKIKVGQRVRFMLTNQSNKEIIGEIYNIGQSFANDTKSVAVHADIEKSDAILIPGMYINALIDIGSNLVQTLPEEAVVMAEGREFIFIWDQHNLELENNEHTHDHDISKNGTDHEEQNESETHYDGELDDDHGNHEEEGHDHDDHDNHDDHGAEGDDDHHHGDDHGGISFSRLEVKTGARQLGFVEVTLLGEIHSGDKIVTKGAYYLQSHLQKSEGGGGHHH